MRVGIVNEMRSEGGFGESVTPITLREVESKLGCPGKIEATCPSGPIPRKVRSKRVSPNSAAYSDALSCGSARPSRAAIM